MGLVFRQSVKATVIIFTGNLIGALVNYFSTYIFKDDFQQFGFVRTFLNISVICQTFVLLGCVPTLQTFQQRYIDRQEKGRVLITICTLIPLAMMLLLLPPYLLFQDHIVQLFQAADRPYFRQFYFWLPPLVLFWCYISLYEGYILSLQKTAVALLTREVILRIFGLLILMVFYFGFISFSGFFILTIFSHLLSAILLLWYSFRAGGFGFSNNWRTFTVAEYKELVHFSWYHLLMGLSLFVIGFLDSLMLAALSEDGVSSVPVYTIAVFITTLMTIPYRAIINAVFPVLNRAYIDQKKDEFYDLFARSSVNIQIVAIAMVIIIGFNLPNAVRVLPKGYESVLPVVWILMLGRMADMATGMNNEVISISSLYKFNFRISVFLIALLVLLNRILIPIYSIYGAAWGTTIAMILFNTAKTIYLRRKMNLWPFSIRSLAILFAGGLAGAVAYCMPYIGNPVADAIIRSLAILIVYILLLLRLRPSPDLNNFVTKIFNRIKTH